MRRRRATFVGLFVACGFFAVLSAAQAATVHRAVVGAHYATIVPACAPPAPGRMTCYALRRLPTSASTPGAVRYVVPAAYPVGPAGGYTPSDFWSAYDLGSEATLTATGGPGTGQTVGIVDAYDDPDIEADLATFDTEYGLPACTTGNGCFTKVGQTGSTTSLPAPDGTSGSDVETSLDVESVRALCPDCHILLVEANSLGLNDLGASVDEAVSLGATEVSNSYGGPESENSSYESDYTHPGVPITVSAGDQGYYNWVDRQEGKSEPAEANAPASYPESVAVGGTSLALNAACSRASETVWNDQYYIMNYGDGGAGGGGCSTEFTAPSWQASEAGYNTANCNGDRLVADVSADGDPLTGFDLYDSYTGPGWQTDGGTSLSAPIIAAVYGLAGGGHSVADPAATLYTNSASASGSLYDVTSGGNGYCDGNYSSCTPPANDDCGQGSTACNAATGYDGPSGVGTPNGLAGFMAGTAYDPTNTSVSCSPGSGDEGVATTCTATVTDTATSGASTPTGVVAVSASIAGSFGSYASCALAATATTGVASCQLPFTPSSGGTYTVTGHYFGDTEHAGSSGTSSTLTSTASVDPTSTSVNCSPASIDEGGQATTCTATVTDTATSGASTPTGTVNLTASIGGSFGPSGASCTLEGAGHVGVASCSANFAPTAAGVYTVSADYLGDGTHGGSEGTSFTLGSSTPIDQTSTSVNCLPASGTEGVATMCTVTVRDTAASGASTPTGPVDFSSSMSGSFAGDADCILRGQARWGKPPAKSPSRRLRQAPTP